MRTPLIKSLSLTLIAGSICIAQTASAAGTVSFYGYQLDTPGWRSTDITKTITLAAGGTIVDTDGYYGTDGWTSLNAFSLPSYISAQSVGSSKFIPGTYEPIDNPGFPVAPIVSDMQSSLLYQIPGSGIESSSLFAFTLGNGAPTSFLMGIAFGNLPLSQNSYLGDSFRVTIGASDSGQVPLTDNNGLIDWVFFQVDGATNGDVINIYGIGSSRIPVPTGYTDLAAISFDLVPIPEPSTMALL